MNKKKIKIGLDFDGVIAYNPFRVVRFPIAYFKKNILGIKKLQFWYPQRQWQKIFWVILHDSSVFPANGVDLLRRLVDEGLIEAHLISARYSFLDEHLFKWLEKYHLGDIFKTININEYDDQPHLFKEKKIKSLGVSYYIEDNLDIVTYIDGRVKAEVYWIYNLLDRNYSYSYKFPYLRKALDHINDRIVHK